MDRTDCFAPPIKPTEPEKPKGESMDKTVAHTIVTAAFDFLEVRAQGRLFAIWALNLVEQMAHAAIDAGLLDYLRQKGALTELPPDRKPVGGIVGTSAANPPVGG